MNTSTLRQSNPAQTWLHERHQTELRLADGKLIVLRFDLESTGQTGYRFDTEKVVNEFGDSILACPETDFGEYLNVASTIADVLNERMDMVARRVFGQVRLSLSLLDALDDDAFGPARLIWEGLVDSLGVYDNTQVFKVWGQWIENVRRYIDTADPPGGLEITFIPLW